MAMSSRRVGAATARMELLFDGKGASSCCPLSRPVEHVTVRLWAGGGLLPRAEPEQKTALEDELAVPSRRETDSSCRHRLPIACPIAPARRMLVAPASLG